VSNIAVIGGSGFAAMPGLVQLGDDLPDTPYGRPSAAIVHGRLAGGGELLFLPRHGPAHRIPPHRINYRANISALKACGAQRVLGLAAVGGIGRGYGPRSLVVPDQLIDYTFGRDHTFFDGGAQPVVHIDLTNPYCDALRSGLLLAGERLGLGLIADGTYGVTQGPRLETAAEVRRLERDGCHIVGMTGMPEAALAREAGLSYACCAFVVNWAAGKAAGEIRMSEIEANIAASLDRIARLLAALSRAGVG
jgi:5'-methylthioadenosine phosphorylase/5'-methylthioinosine phosphorylase